ncbi:MAG: transposase [Candidatus Muproteobacteria bacterium RBG_16_62_13]|uniref:Transposase n=1 Tax=Candidatus Muproteobacteria bacterium RBG_16_62_13 TaxID=1817756 RepID=A0A1F6T066_9PROT|nr:MAG: transposase [Candidatus Muproteobacteria bacterium RBG_16_62_13]
MPRKPRFYLPDIPAHVVQRGNCRQATFFADEDYAAYLNWLHEGARQQGCALHAYALMTNHVHLLVTPQDSEAISRLIQFVGRHYVMYVNHTYAKSGTLWEGRHKGCVISSDDYLLACMRYIELNPVRAGMVASPDDYRWSSYRINAAGGGHDAITPHPLYLALGKDRKTRGDAYRELFRSALDSDRVHAIRATVQTGTPLGNECFKQQIERTLQRQVGQARRGRPEKVAE